MTLTERLNAARTPNAGGTASRPPEIGDRLVELHANGRVQCFTDADQPIHHNSRLWYPAEIVHQDGEVSVLIPEGDYTRVITHRLGGTTWLETLDF